MPEGGEEPIRITLRDVWHAVNEIKSGLAAVKTTIELNALTSLNDTAKVQDHEKRIRTLEHWMWALPATGVAAVAAAVVALIK